MTVAFKSPLTSSNLNAKLISRTTDQSASGVIDFENGIKFDGDLVQKASGVIDVGGSGGIKLPDGNTAARPTAGNGVFRYNVETNKFEGYENGSWTNFISAASSISIVAKTANYTTTDSDEVIYVDGTSGAFAITLHTPSNNQRIIIKRTDNTLANVVSVTGTVDGATNKKLHTQFESYEFIYSTSLAAWRQLNHETDTGPVTYTPTYTGFGTVVTQTSFWRRKGSFLEFYCTFLCATSTGTEARVSIPATTIAGLPTISLAGFMAKSAATVGSYCVLAEASTAYFTFGLQDGSRAGLTKVLGNAIFTSGQTYSFFASVPIVDWQP